MRSDPTSVSKFLMALGELHQVARHRARILQPQHGAAADSAALRFDRLARKRGQRHREGLALRAQRLNRVLHLARLAGIEPTAERKHAMRFGDAEDFKIAVDVWPIGCRRPVHHHLPLGQQQRVGAIEFVAQARDLVARGRFEASRTRAHAQKHDRGDHGKQNEAKHRREDCDVVAVDALIGVEREFLHGEKRLLLCARRRRPSGQGGQ